MRKLQLTGPGNWTTAMMLPRSATPMRMFTYSILTCVSLMSSSWLPKMLSQFLISLKLRKSITDVCWK